MGGGRGGVVGGGRGGAVGGGKGGTVRGGRGGVVGGRRGCTWMAGLNRLSTRPLLCQWNEIDS